MRKFLTKYSLILLVVVLTIVVVIILNSSSYSSQSGYRGSLYLIYSPDSDFQEINKKNIERKYSSKYKGDFDRILTTDSIYINKKFVDLINEIKIAQRINCQTNHFVFLNQPYDINLKKMRHNLELHFQGESRRVALRSIVPVIKLRDFDEQYTVSMLVGNLRYIEDNYQGVGFFIDDSNMELLELYNKILLDNFVEDSDT